MTDRETKFLRVHRACAHREPFNMKTPLIVHVSFGCMPGSYRLTTNFPIPRDDPVPERDR